MASVGHSAFSNSGEFLAHCGQDGKLKIWETSTSRLKQEYTPNQHLASPCSVIGWLSVGTSVNSSVSPWKKRKKKSISEDAQTKEMVALGSMNGSVSLYDISTGSISDQLIDGHSSMVTAITWSQYTGLYTAADKHIVEWNIAEKTVKCKWKSGKGKVTSLQTLPEGKSLLSGERTIKWWDLETKQIIGTFTGHANQVNKLLCAKINSETSYLFSSATGDNYLSVWSLNEVQKDKVPVAILTVPDEVLSFSLKPVKDSQINVASVTRSGQAQVFKYQANGTFSKPIKPALNILVAADSEQKGPVQQIPVLVADVIEDDKILLAYGSFTGLTIEKVIVDYSDKVQCLVRKDLRKTKPRKEEAVTKVKSTAEHAAQYLGPGDEIQPTAAKRKSGAGSQLPLKERLENLSIGAESSTSGKTTSKGENMTQLLIQGLHNEDQNLLSNVLYIKKESVIKNTVAKLPAQAVIPFLKVLKKMLEGKVFACMCAITWIRELAFAHTATMIAHPEIKEALDPILSILDAKISFLPEIIKLQGRVELMTGQIADRASRQEKDVTEECLLVYQDQDSSEEDIDNDKDGLNSESDDNWEETSEQEQMQEDVENGKSDEDISICSSD